MGCSHAFVPAPKGEDVRREVCVNCSAERWQTARNVTIIEHPKEGEAFGSILSYDPTLSIRLVH